MAPSPSKISKTSSSTSARATFFAPRNRRNVVARNYANIQRNEVNPQNPPRPSTAATDVQNDDSLPADDTIEVQYPPGHANYDSDEDTTETTAPDLSTTTLTEAEKMEAIKKWLAHKTKHTKKKRDKSSYVYWYMERRVVDGCFYSECKDGPRILQEYRWNCLLCRAQSSHLSKKFSVLESSRHGVTSGMVNHLKVHKITADSHTMRLHGYSEAIGGGDYTELDGWSGKSRPRARLTAKEATRRWFVKTRQPFSQIESDEFQEMFIAHGRPCAYKSRLTLRNHIFDDFCLRRERLKIELERNCISISFTLDMWTSPNRKPIFAIIGRWYTADFEEREEVLEFVEVRGSHAGEDLAKIVEKLCAQGRTACTSWPPRRRSRGP
jgi:hypothetical protein